MAGFGSGNWLALCCPGKTTQPGNPPKGTAPSRPKSTTTPLTNFAGLVPEVVPVGNCLPIEAPTRPAGTLVARHAPVYTATGCSPVAKVTFCL